MAGGRGERSGLVEGEAVVLLGHHHPCMQDHCQLCALAVHQWNGGCPVCGCRWGLFPGHYWVWALGSHSIHGQWLSFCGCRALFIGVGHPGRMPALSTGVWGLAQVFEVCHMCRYIVTLYLYNPQSLPQHCLCLCVHEVTQHLSIMNAGSLSMGAGSLFVGAWVVNCRQWGLFIWAGCSWLLACHSWARW